MSQVKMKQIAGLTSALALKAPLASPSFTGTPTVPTVTSTDSSTTIASTAFVKSLAANSNPLMDGTVAIGTSVLYARQDHVHPTDTSRAPLASPAFTGTPTAPTATSTDNSTTIATTAFVKSLGYLTANQNITFTGDVTGSGTTSVELLLNDVNASTGTFGSANSVAVVTVGSKGLVTQVSEALITPASIGAAPINSPALTGTPTAPTATVTDSSTQIATTAFVKNQNYITAAALTPYATLASPTFTGTPTAPTPSTTDSSTQIATTAYVQAQGFATDTNVVHLTGDESIDGTKTFTSSPVVPTVTATDSSTKVATTAFVKSLAGTANPLMDGSVAVGTSTFYSRQDHVHPSDTSRAPLASPTFTGSPTAPTPTAGDSSTLLATTAFVATSYAPLASPALIGTPTAPTPTVTDNSTTIATTAFVKAQGYAPLASPTFTGTPTAPTPTAGDTSTAIATTNFVSNAISTALLSAMVYKGAVDITAAPPASPEAGWMYRVETGGTPNAGYTFSTTVTVVDAGDHIIYNGTTWDREADVNPSVTAGTGITVTPTGDTTYSVAVSTAYAGGSSIATVGTITSGTWQGDTIAVSEGGTGVTTLAANSVLATTTVDTVVPVALANNNIIGRLAGNITALTGSDVRTMCNVRRVQESGFATSGSMTLMTLSQTPQAGTAVQITFNGVLLTYTTDFTVSGSTVTATNALNISYGGSTNDGLGFENDDVIVANYEY